MFSYDSIFSYCFFLKSCSFFVVEKLKISFFCCCLLVFCIPPETRPEETSPVLNRHPVRSFFLKENRNQGGNVIKKMNPEKKCETNA